MIFWSQKIPNIKNSIVFMPKMDFENFAGKIFAVEGGLQNLGCSFLYFLLGQPGWSYLGVVGGGRVSYSRTQGKIDRKREITAKSISSAFFAGSF